MTPRTDREIWWVGFKPDEKLEAVWADFARDLERENAALLAELDATRKLLGVHILRSDLFSYLAWLEDHRDHGDFSVKGKDYLVLLS